MPSDIDSAISGTLTIVIAKNASDFKVKHYVHRELTIEPSVRERNLMRFMATPVPVSVSPRPQFERACGYRRLFCRARGATGRTLVAYPLPTERRASNVADLPVKLRESTE